MEMELNSAVDPQETAPIETMDDFDSFTDGLAPHTDPASAEPAPAPEPEPEPTPDLTQLSQGQQNAAFAQMRIQQRQLQQAMQTVLQRAGLDPKLAENPQQVLELLDNAAVEEQAQQMNVPSDLLARLNYLERQNKASEMERAQHNALQGFQAVQTRYNLTQPQLQQFAMQLQQAGLNPFEQVLDIEKEFIYHNLDWVLAQEREKATREVETTRQKAAQYATAPPAMRGKPPTTPSGDKINTPAQFERFLYELGK